MRCPRSARRGAISLKAVSNPEISRSGARPRSPNMPMRSDPLIGTPSTRHRGNRARENAKVERQRPMLDVMPIETDDFLEVDDVAAAAHLPQPAQSRRNGKTPEVMRLVILEIRLEERPRA